MEHSLQLAFPLIDPTDGHDERIVELISVAESYRPTDSLRALYFAHEALTLAQSQQRPDLELLALELLIGLMTTGDRLSEATPFILRAIELADATDDADRRSSLLGILGAWAIEVEQGLPLDRIGSRPPMDWALAMIARLERNRASAEQDDQTEPLPTPPPSASTIDDPATGLLNVRGLAAELLSLEERRSGYAIIQIVLGASSEALLKPVAQLAGQFVGDRGLLARNAPRTLTAVLPLFTGIAAMSMAEQMRRAFIRLSPDKDASIAIGVAIRQPGETSRDLLQRVADRTEEAAALRGINVAG